MTSQHVFSFQLLVFTRESFTNKDRLGMMVVTTAVNALMHKEDNTDAMTGQ